MSKRRTTTQFSFLLLLLIVLSSCQGPFSPQLKHRQPLPPGMGYLSVSVSQARTILPAAKNLNDFSRIDFVFTATSGGTSVTENSFNPTTSNLFILDAGTYTLTVNAYIGSGLAARGTANNITITAGGDASASVSLKALFDEGIGTFSWDITIATDEITVTSATMTIMKGGSQQGDVENLSLTEKTTQSRNLNSGMYTVTFNLAGEDNKSLVWNELLYIYAELTSSFDITFDDDHFNKTHWNVTFNANYDGGGVETQSVMHGEVVVSSQDPTRPFSLFEGWFTDASGNSSYNFATHVTGDFTLYAKWNVLEDGSAEKPFQVNDDTDLRAVGRGGTAGYTEGGYASWTLDKHYEQADNINLTGEWTPIGYIIFSAGEVAGGESFKGSYNGSSKTITGLTIKATTDTRGLFGYIHQDGTVKNVILADVDIEGGVFSGGVAGGNAGTVVNCYFITGTIKDGDYVGGVVGYNWRTVEGCYSGGSVEGNQWVGGVVGYNYENGSIQSCYSMGNVEASSYSAGGVVGENYGTVINCYSTGNVSANDSDAGGVAGYNEGTIENCYSTGDVKVIDILGNSAGGVVGDNSLGTVRNSVALGTGVISYANIGRVMGNGTGNNNYARSEMALMSNGSTVNANSNLTGKDGADVNTSTPSGGYHAQGFWSGLGWDFGTVWSWHGVNNLPILQNAGGTQNPKVREIATTAVTSVSLNNTTLTMINGGTTTLTATVLPENATNKNVTWSTNNDSVATVSANNNTVTITAVGGGVATITVTTQDGGKTMECTVTVSALGGDGSGSGTLSDPFIVGSADTLQKIGTGEGDWLPSAFYKQTADIDLTGVGDWIPLCYDPIFTGTYNGNGYTISHLNNSLFDEIDDDGVVENLRLEFENLSVSNSSNFGGVAKTNRGAVTNCSVSCNVTNTNSYSPTGGVVGYNYGTVENCYSTGDISGTSYIGGVVGYNLGIVRNCYATGNITGSSSYIGGIVGGNTGEVEYCYATGNITGSAYVGGVVGGSSSLPVNYCVVLGLRVTISSNNSDGGRVLGIGNTNNSNLYSRNDMSVNNGSYSPIPGQNLKDGQNIMSQDWNSAAWWTDTVGFDADVWIIEDNKLPILKGVPGVQNLTVP